jgi:hypothetical protein
VPSIFALKLSEQLCQFLSLSASEEARSEFANAIDFHAKFLGETSRDDLAPLLFLECVEESEKRKQNIPPPNQQKLQMADLHTLLSRVQKRIFRGARSRERSASALIQSQPSGQHVESIVTQHVMEDFRTYVATILSPRDGVIFESRFIRGKTISEICHDIGAEKSTVYERIRLIKEVFARFLEDVGYPGFHGN